MRSRFFCHFTRILLLLPLLGAAPRLWGTTAMTGSGVAIDMDRSSAESLETLDELRMLDRQLVMLFRVGVRKLPLQCRIAVSGTLPKGKLQVEYNPGEWVLSFNDRGGDWLDDFELRRKLLGLMLLAKLPGAEPPSNPDWFPAWIAAGIDARVRASRTSESVMRRNRWFPVLRALSESGEFPDFRRMRLLDPALLPPSAFSWYRELSRAMLELGVERSSAVDNALLDYVILSVRPGGIESRNFQSSLGRVFLAGARRDGLPEQVGLKRWNVLDTDARIQLALESYARRLAFVSLFPQPVPMAEKEFASLDKFEFPVLDVKGVPTGKSVAVKLDDFPERLLDRPDAALLQHRLHVRILTLRGGNDSTTRRLLEKLSDAALRLPARRKSRENGPSSPTAQFRQLVARIHSHFERREKIERFLDRVEAENRIPAEFYGDAIREVNRPSPVLTARERKFVDRVEREWLDD